MRKWIIGLVLGGAILAAVAYGVHRMGHHASLSEGGQGGFTALIEVVERLQADPHTDWTQVDIDALHRHLVDMDALMLQTTVVKTVGDGVVEFQISGTPRGLEAAKRMVPAHAGILRESGFFDVSSEVGETVILRVSFGDLAQRQQIEALGFYGLMATDAHHGAHHWAMASGQGVHAH